MKTPMKFFGAVVIVLVALLALNAHAEGEVVCIIQANTGAATTTGTQTALGDGGSPCSWAPGAVVAMQGVNCVVCYDPTASQGGTANVQSDLCINFQTGELPADPALIALRTQQQKLSMIAKSVGDGGTLCNVKMALTHRRSQP